MVHNIRLFESNATDFSTNGLGCLHEATSCRVTEERNGIYELTLNYPTNGHLYEDLVNNAIIVAKPNPFANPQAFRIYSLSKPVRGIVTYNAAHISYDMSNYPVNTPVSTSAGASIQTAFNALNSHIVVPTDQTFPFTFTKNETGSHGTIQVGKLDLKKPVSVKNALGGTDGSILDGFHVEYEFDNYTVIAYNQRGTNNGMSIRYGKNLLSLNYSEDISEAYTHVYPYYYSEEYGLVTIATSSRSSLIPLVENPTYFKVLMLDVTESFPAFKPSADNVYNTALTKISDNNYAYAKVSVDISFVQLGKSSEYEKFKELESVKLCDTVNCYNEEVGINFTAKCVRTVYDAISDKYEEITLGDPKVNLFKAFTDQTNKARSIIVETISGVEDALSGGIAIAQSTAEAAQSTATGAQTTATAAQSTANTAQNGVNALNTLFSDASGRSHVTLKKNAADSAIEEIIVSDDPDYMATTTHLWRWNSDGLAYTNGGYNSSEYILGMNMNGKIWANYIDVQDTDGNSIFVADGQNKFVHMGLFNINELGLTYNYTERTEPNIHKSINIDPYAITFEKIDDNNDTIDRIYISPESIYFNQERTIGSHSLELTNKHVNLTYNDDCGIYLEMPSASGPIFRIGSSDDGPAPNAFSISYDRVTENKAYLTLNGQTISGIATTIENSNSSVPTSALLYSVKNQIPTVVDNHTSTSTTAALSANQGKVLYDLIQQGGGSVDIIDNLTSTRTDAALSANQGRVLKALIPSNVSELVNDSHYITESRTINGQALSSNINLTALDINMDGTAGSITISGAYEILFNNKQDKITSTNKLSASLVSDLATVATSGSYNDLSDKPTIPSGITGAGVFYGVCSTAAATAAKTVTLSRGDGFTLTTGVTVLIKFTATNSAANPTLNVNGTGAKALMQYGTTAMSTTAQSTGWRANAIVALTYDGTNWVRTHWENSVLYYTSIYSTSSGSSAAKVGNVSGGFSLTAGKNFQVMMYSNNTSASALTLNIASTGAKPIYINGQPSSATNYTLPAGEYLVYYDGTNYYFDTDGTFRVKNIIADNFATLTDSTPYLFRKSGGDLDVGNRESIKKLVGGTIAWNQLMENGAFAISAGWAKNNSNISISGGICTLTATAQNGLVHHTAPRVNGHIFAYLAEIKTTTATNAVYISSAGSRITTSGSVATTEWQTLFAVRSLTVNTNANVGILDYRTSDWDAIQIRKVLVFDLTQMFGDIIATQVLNAETATKWTGYNLIKSFLENASGAYSTGRLVSVNPTAHETVGFNAWDEVCESGSLDDNTGEPVSASNLIRSKNYCRCIPGTDYYFYCGTADGLARVFFYDEDKNLVEKRNNRNNMVVTSPVNATYFKIRLAVTYGTVYKNDICINISNLSRDGTYEPYVKHTYPIYNVELRGIPKLDANNKLYYDGDEYTADGTVTRKYGIANLGDFVWVYNEDYLGFVTNTILPGAKISYVGICQRYSFVGAYTRVNDKECGYIFNRRVIVKDSAYGTDATAFKTAMSGVYLIYELESPTTESASPMINPQVIDSNGTEEFVDTRAVPIPVGHETVYLSNVIGNAVGELLQPIKPSLPVSFRVITLSGDYDVLTGQDFADYYTNPSPAHMIYHSGQRQYYYLQLKDSDTDPKIYYVCPSSSTSYAIRDTIEVTPTGYWSLWA